LQISGKNYIENEGPTFHSPEEIIDNYRMERETNVVACYQTNLKGISDKLI